MRLSRNIDGRDFANHLIQRWQFREERQTWSHIILRSDAPISVYRFAAGPQADRGGNLEGIVTYISIDKQVPIAELLSGL